MPLDFRLGVPAGAVRPAGPHVRDRLGISGGRQNAGEEHGPKEFSDQGFFCRGHDPADGLGGQQGHGDGEQQPETEGEQTERQAEGFAVQAEECEDQPEKGGQNESLGRRVHPAVTEASIKNSGQGQQKQGRPCPRLDVDEPFRKRIRVMRECVGFGGRSAGTRENLRDHFP